MDFSHGRAPRSRGDGQDWDGRLAACGEGTVVEPGVRIVHPENVHLGAAVFVGHDTYIDAHFQGRLTIGDGTWIGQMCFLHGAGGIEIGRAVGMGPRVIVLTSEHEIVDRALPVLHAPLRLAPVKIGDGADIGAGSVILPGVRIGEGAVVGAGAVVTADVEDYAVVVGNPARLLRER